MTAAPGRAERRRFRPLRLLAGLLVALFAACYLLALGALSDLDAIVAEGPEAIAAAEAPLSATKDWALFLTAQILPLRQPGAAGIAPGRVFKDCPDCPEMVEIPAGFYLMGSPFIEWNRHRHLLDPRPLGLKLRSLNREGPRRLVRIAHAFALSRYEITFAQWEAAQDDPRWAEITGTMPREPDLGVADYQNRAVTMVNLSDAMAFADYVSAKTGKRYRVPSEAEWEYAARAGTVTARPWGDAIGINHASCLGCSDKWTERRIGPVGLYPPNGFGLYDMIGNGREWVRDCFLGHISATATDGAAYVVPNCVFGVAKGESAYAESWRNRSAYRVGPHARNRREGGTIRLLREMD